MRGDKKIVGKGKYNGKYLLLNVIKYWFLATFSLKIRIKLLFQAMKTK